MTELTSWVTDIAEYLKATGFMAGKVYAYSMPNGVQPAAMIIPPLQGLSYDLELPKYYTGEYQCLIRTANLANAHQLAANAIEHLTLSGVTVGGSSIRRSVPMHTPIVYPSSDGAYYEASVTFDLKMIDQRIYSQPSTTNPGAGETSVNIWFDIATGALMVNSSAYVYPAQSLEVIEIGNLLVIKVKASGVIVAGPKNFGHYGDKDGNTFVTKAEVVQYLSNEFAKTGAVVVGGQSFEHTQAIAADQWTVTHSFGAYPSQVSVYVGGSLVMASVANINTNTLLVSFLAPQTGTVTVSL
jgi:hypothetical protein